MTYRKYDLNEVFLIIKANKKKCANVRDRNSENGREKTEQNEMKKNKNSFIFDVWFMLPEIDVVRNRLC